MTIKNTKIYDFLKWLGRYCLPSLSAFIFTLSEILGIHGLAVASAIISALVVCLNSMLGMSNENYKINRKDEAFNYFITDIESELKKEQPKNE